ncbi:MAG: TonB family protein [Deltaproteobacteria bacterium]|nr:TonB family protein [Deltaproteobacteria bacterium]
MPVGRGETKTVSNSTPPVLKKFVKAEYPRSAVQDKVEGTVILELHVDKEGKVSRAIVIESVRDDVDRAAIEAARRFRFQPAMVKGIPVGSVVRYESSFVLPRDNKQTGERKKQRKKKTIGYGKAEAAGNTGKPKPGSDSDSIAEFTQVVKGRRPPRAASDWRIEVSGRLDPGTVSPGRLLAMAPGLHVAQHGGVGKAQRIFLRGFDAVHGQDLEINVEGIPVNEVSNIHAHGYADLNYLIPEVISSMRVIEGAYDPRQGDFAVAGSVWIDLGLKHRGLTAKAGGGSFGRARALIAWGPRGEPDATFAAAEYARGDGFGPARSWNRAAAIGQYVLKISPGTNLKLLATSYTGRFASAGVVKEEDYDNGIQGFYDTYDPHQGGLSVRHQAMAAVEHESNGSRAELAFHAGYRELRLRHDFTGFIFEYRPIDNPKERGRHLGDLTEQYQEGLTLGGYGSYAKEVRFRGGTYALEAGFRFRHDRADQSQKRLRAVDQEPYWDEIEAKLAVTDIGLYLDAEARPSSWLRIRGGVRFDTLSYIVNEPMEYYGKGNRRDAQGVHIGPKATLEFVPGHGLSVFLCYGNGFRSPYGIALSQGERTPFVTVHAGELGLRWRLGDWLDVSAAGFFTHVAEDLVFDHATGRYLYSGATSRAGTTVSAKLRPLDWLYAFLSGSYAYSVLDETGKLLPYTVPITFRAGMGVKRNLTVLWGHELSISARLIADVIGPRPLPYSEETNTVFLLSADFGLTWGDLELSAEAFNLLDTKWRDDEFAYVSNFHNNQETPSLVPDRHFTAGRPITIMAYLTWHVF